MRQGMMHEELMDRRKFARLGAAAIASAATAPLLTPPSQAATRAAPYKLSVMLWTFPEKYSFDLRLESAAEAGYHAVELVDEFARWSEAEFRRIGQKNKELGLTFDAAALMNASAANSQSRNHFLGSLRNMLPTLEKLECPNLIVLSGDQVPGLSRAQQHAACVETLLRAAELVDKTPYSLLLENIDPEENPKYFLTSVVEGFEIIRKVGHPRVRFLYDLFHEQIAEGNLITKLEKNIDLVGLIHVADVPGRHEPGTGEINFANVYTTLARLNYNRYVAMEFEPLGDPVAALRTAREMALAPNR